MNNKILNENELKKKIFDLKKKNKTISHCHGVFDLLHLGHIKHFEEAKSLSDILIVSITADKLVNKGPGRPYFNQKSRLHAIASLQVVDFVCLSDHFRSIYDFQISDTSPFRKDDFTTIIGAELHTGRMGNGEIWHFLAVGLPLDFEPPSETETAPDMAVRTAGLFATQHHPPSC